MKHFHSPSPLWPLRVFFLIALASTAVTCKGGRSPGSTNAAPPLFAYGDLDQNGNFLPVSNDPSGGPFYRPYYETGDMNTPRYLHQVIRLKNGLIFITGGTDERGYSALDTAEIYDETLIRKGDRIPPSKTGSWIDTDFAGNPMTMENRRFWHTMTTLPDNRIIIMGGAANWLKARPTEKVEVFNLETRSFETLKDAKMVHPRVRHTANTLPNGNIVIMGGLVHDIFVEIFQGQVSGGGISGGTITQQFQNDIFPSTNSIEVFSFTDLLLEEMTLRDSTRLSTLTSSRGRAGHVTVQFAGFDDKLETGDDLFFLVGGMQTPSRETGALVQPIMVPRITDNNTPLRNIEVLDPTTQAVIQVPVQLRFDRVNDPQCANLGFFNERTPDGISGMANVLMVCCGDNNAACFTTPSEDELFVASFTGQGPAQGLTVNRITYLDAATPGHRQGFEAATNRDTGMGPVPEVPVGLSFVYPGRTGAQIVTLPRTVESRPGEQSLSTWVFVNGGVHTTCVPPNSVLMYWQGTIGAGAIFDPLYRLLPVAAFNQVPRPSARDLVPTRQDSNPTGILGAWLALDGRYPSTDRIGYGDTTFSYTPGIWPSNLAHRVYCRSVNVAGEDGIYDTIDDRVLTTGGGQNPVDQGGEASVPSAELILIPKSPP